MAEFQGDCENYLFEDYPLKCGIWTGNSESSFQEEVLFSLNPANHKANSTLPPTSLHVAITFETHDYGLKY
jgi:hypothetical protein